jgi:pilus assembly protein FimV
VHKFKLKQITIAACFALMPFAAYAAGLGKLTVISGLGEPLNAEIELVSVTPEELPSLSAAIASSEAYAAQGVERTSLHGSIKIETSKRANGTPILKLTTPQPVSDPFLDMLVQVDWPTGRLLREYTALLDPPGYSASSTGNNPPAAASSPSSGDTSSVLNAREQKSQARNTSRKSKAAVRPAPDDLSGNAGEEHETRRGDTLSAIAKQMQVEGVSLDQMLVGLYQANKDAFSGGNMNRLKVGQIIRAPSADELQAIPQQEAASEIRVQTADWNAYRNKLAGIVAEKSASSEDADNQSSGGKLTAAAEDKAAPAASGPRDVVKLSKSDTGTENGNKADVKALQDKLTAMQEEGIAREKSVKEANERTAALEKQIADMQKLLAVKNQAMAEIQKNAGATTAPAPAATPAPVAPPPAQAEAAKDVKPPETPAPAAQEPAKPETPAVAANAEPAKPQADKPKKKRIVMPPPAPVEEPGLLDELLAAIGENTTLLAGLGGALVLGGGAWLFLRNKRKHGLDSFEQGILTSGGLKANTVFGNTSGDTVDTGDTSFLTDFSQSPGGMIDTHDVDPIAEAEVYMAYGRESQAEEILKDAIGKEPKRYELHLKLLEIFAGRNDSSAFEAVAGELYSTLGANDPVWAKVAELGHKVEPDNPLYEVSAVIPTATAKAATTQKLDASDFDSAEVMTESSLDFSLDAGSDAGSSSEGSVSSGQDSSLDFDLGSAKTVPGEDLSASFDMPSAGDATPAASLDKTTALDIGNDIGDMGSSLDFPEQSLKTQILGQGSAQGLDSETTGGAGSADNLAAEFGQTLPGLEMPEIGIEIPTVAPDLPDEPSFSDEIVFEIPAADKPEDDGGLDFNFDMGAVDIPAMEEPEITEISMEVASASPEANNVSEINLSDISFDLGSAPAVAVEAAGGNEPEDVNTKLDLVTAYIDMGDKEGARELLDEVLKEGGAQQRERAQQMLSSLA